GGMLTLIQGKKIVNHLRSRLAFEYNGQLIKILSKNIVAVGSLRREEKMLNDVDLLIIVPEKKLLKHVLPNIRIKGLSFSVKVCGERKCVLFIEWEKKTYQLDLFTALAEEKPYAIFHFTGPVSYLIRIRAALKKKNYKLNQYGLFKNQTLVPLKITTEKELIKELGFTYRIPKKRL
nr:Chain A, Repair DNA polymerase X [African swine fever virus BA71V]8ILE_B Chain B, Repair DNA polymerase X [African swine fever virus BA71V]